jgi:DNA-binding XRE family transcriptional regulator
MQAHTRKLHTENSKSPRVSESQEKSELVDWRTAFGDLIEKFTEAGVALKGFRLREGWTQAEVAEKIGIDQANLSRMERGKRAIGKAMAKKLAAVFKTDYHIFL